MVWLQSWQFDFYDKFNSTIMERKQWVATTATMIWPLVIGS